MKCISTQSVAVTCLLLIPLMSGCSATTDGDLPDRSKVAFVTNGVASFWVIAGKGVEKGGEEFDVQTEVVMPTGGSTDQQRILEDLVSRGFDGIAVSPIDPENQTGLIDSLAQYTNVITQDSDAPNSKRLAYIGVDNYDAGRQCGELVAEAIPEGGKVAIFVGRLGQDNARRRRQGVIDVLMDRSHDPDRFDAPDATPQNEKYQSRWNLYRWLRSLGCQRQCRRCPFPPCGYRRNGGLVRIQPRDDFGGCSTGWKNEAGQNHCF